MKEKNNNCDILVDLHSHQLMQINGGCEKMGRQCLWKICSWNLDHRCKSPKQIFNKENILQ